jgi:hypothetical protein
MDSDVAMFAQVMTIIVVSTGAFVLIGLGAYILWRWGSRTKPSALARHDEAPQIQHLQTAVDAVAIEVERISEAQRFMVSLLSESLPARRAELAAPDKAAGREVTPH